MIPQTPKEALPFERQHSSDQNLDLIGNVTKNVGNGQDFAHVNKIIDKHRRSSGLGYNGLGLGDISILDAAANGNGEDTYSGSVEARLEGMEDPFKESWNQTQVKLRKHSEYASYKTFALKMMIVKANDDLRQEYLAMQLMKRLQ